MIIDIINGTVYNNGNIVDSPSTEKIIKLGIEMNLSESFENSKKEDNYVAFATYWRSIDDAPKLFPISLLLMPDGRIERGSFECAWEHSKPVYGSDGILEFREFQGMKGYWATADSGVPFEDTPVAFAPWPDGDLILQKLKDGGVI